mgnify:CR=1 FL=1
MTSAAPGATPTRCSTVLVPWLASMSSASSFTHSIHWPVPSQGLAADTWRAMEKLYHDGRIRAIGVSNFHGHHLEALMRTAEVRPTVNQVELHPYHQQRDVRDADDRLEIATEAWSPLAKGRKLLGDPVVAEIASRRDRTPAQVVPLVKDGRVAACLAVHQRTARAWTPAEVTIIRDVAERDPGGDRRQHAHEHQRHERVQLDLHDQEQQYGDRGSRDEQQGGGAIGRFDGFHVDHSPE